MFNGQFAPHSFHAVFITSHTCNFSNLLDSWSVGTNTVSLTTDSAQRTTNLLGSLKLTFRHNVSLTSRSSLPFNVTAKKKSSTDRLTGSFGCLVVQCSLGLKNLDSRPASDWSASSGQVTQVPCRYYYYQGGGVGAAPVPASIGTRTKQGKILVMWSCSDPPRFSQSPRWADPGLQSIYWTNWRLWCECVSRFWSRS